MTGPRPTSPRIGSEDLRSVLARLSQCEFLKDFKKTGKARYVSSVEDGIEHGVMFHIERGHTFALFVTPMLTIDHKQARHIRNVGIGRRSKQAEEFALLLTSLRDISPTSMEVGGEYRLLPSAYKALLGRRDLFYSGSFWRSMDELEDLAKRIDTDLRNGGPEFFRDRDTLPKLLDWLESDPWAGGTATRIIVLCLRYVQGQHEEILRTVEGWTAETASPIELRFAKYIADQIHR